MIFMQRAPITLDFNEFLKEYKLQDRMKEGQDESLKKTNYTKYKMPKEFK